MSSAKLFEKYARKEAMAQMALTRKTEQRRVRDELKEQFPNLSEEHWEQIFPKKTDLMIVRCKNQVNMIALAIANPEVLFFQHHGGPFMPEIHLLHKYPFMMSKSVQVDVGGCKYILAGANIMCPGVTSKGGRIDDDIEEDDVVGVFIEGKKLPIAVGVALMDADDIRKKNKGVCVDNVHFMGDPLWFGHVLGSIPTQKKDENEEGEK